MSNYSFADPTDIPDGATIDGGNFTQMHPDTEIMVGKTLTINGGNFTNVKRQPEWIINGGNFKQIERCSHLTPELVEAGLAECGVYCAHHTSEEDVTIDGVVIDTIHTYETSGWRG